MKKPDYNATLRGPYVNWQEQGGSPCQQWRTVSQAEGAVEKEVLEQEGLVCCCVS